MSERDRLRRMMGLRPSQPLSASDIQPVVVVQHCLLRQDGLGNQFGVAGKAQGSILFAINIAPAATIVAVTNITQLPGTTGSVTAGGYVAIDQFFKPGWWSLRLKGKLISATTTPRIRFNFLPRNPSTQLLELRSFIGASSSNSPPQFVFGGNSNPDLDLEFDAYFPEAWAILIDVVGDLAVGNACNLWGAITLECGLDDIPAALHPQYYP